MLQGRLKNTLVKSLVASPLHQGERMKVRGSAPDFLNATLTLALSPWKGEAIRIALSKKIFAICAALVSGFSASYSKRFQ